MKAHKLEVFIIDFDDVGAEGIKEVLEYTKYPNRCIDPMVKDIKTVDIGEWRDDHPLNKFETCEEEYKRLFQ